MQVGSDWILVASLFRAQGKELWLQGQDLRCRDVSFQSSGLESFGFAFRVRPQGSGWGTNMLQAASIRHYSLFWKRLANIFTVSGCRPSILIHFWAFTWHYQLLSLFSAAAS